MKKAVYLDLHVTVSGDFDPEFDAASYAKKLVETALRSFIPDPYYHGRVRIRSVEEEEVEEDDPVMQQHDPTPVDVKPEEEEAESQHSDPTSL